MVDRSDAWRQAAAGETTGASALGPRGKGLFGRLLGSLRSTPLPRLEAPTIAIASGKGGTGKSFVATSLAVLLHQQGLGTTLVDCDFGLACDHLLIGVKPNVTMQQLLQGRAPLSEVRVATPCGPYLVPGASGVRKMASLTDRELLALGRELGAVANIDDAVILDLGAGIAPQTVLTMLAADHIVLVTQPEIAALVDAYAVVKCISQMQPNVRFLVVVNRVTVRGRGEQAFQKLTEVAKQHTGVELVYLGEIADDPRVGQHRLGQLPLVAIDPGCAVVDSLRAVVTRMQEIVGPLKKREVAYDQSIEARFKERRLFL